VRVWEWHGWDERTCAEAVNCSTVRGCRASTHTRTHRATPRTGHLHEQVGARCVRTQGLGSRRRDGGRHFFPFPYAVRMYTHARAHARTLYHTTHAACIHTRALVGVRAGGLVAQLVHCIGGATACRWQRGQSKAREGHRETMGLYEELARVHAPSSALNTPLASNMGRGQAWMCTARRAVKSVGRACRRTRFLRAMFIGPRRHRVLQALNGLIAVEGASSACTSGCGYPKGGASGARVG